MGENKISLKEKLQNRLVGMTLCKARNEIGYLGYNINIKLVNDSYRIKDQYPTNSLRIDVSIMDTGYINHHTTIDEKGASILEVINVTDAN